MKWKMVEPEYGDIIRIKVGSIYHYGIYVSDDEIIQFGLPPIDCNLLFDSDIKVCFSNMDDFLVNGFLEVCQLNFFEKCKSKKADKVVNYARRMIGKGGYNIIHNNCEHFVYLCKFGKKKSTQVDALREDISKKV